MQFFDSRVGLTSVPCPPAATPPCPMSPFVSLCIPFYAHPSALQAIAIANDSIYGLSGAVTSGSLDRAKRVGRRIRTGEVVLNGGPFNVSLCMDEACAGESGAGVGRAVGVGDGLGLGSTIN